MKKLLTILLAVMFLVAPIAFAEELTNETTEGTTSCPEFVSPAPDFCASGTITSGGIDENGCQLPPSCTMNDESTTETTETNLSDTESQAISDTITTETEATENVSVTPDMPLRWGLKTWTEKFSLLLTFNKFKKAEKKLEQAKERLQEMKQMAAKHNLKALVKAQIAHAELVVGLVKDEETLGNDNLTAVEKIQTELEKHILVLESVEAKLIAKGVPTQGVENALVKSRNALDKFQNMSETRKARLSEKTVKKGKEKIKEGSEEESETVEEPEVSVDTIKVPNDCAEGNLSCTSPKT